jgi:nucleoid-associated protein YgaU
LLDNNTHQLQASPNALPTAIVENNEPSTLLPTQDTVGLPESIIVQRTDPEAATLVGPIAASPDVERPADDNVAVANASDDLLGVSSLGVNSGVSSLGGNSLQTEQTTIDDPNVAKPHSEGLAENSSDGLISAVATKGPSVATPLPSPAPNVIPSSSDDASVGYSKLVKSNVDNPNIDEPSTVKVLSGDTFVTLSRKFYHTEKLAQALFHYNRKQVVHPDGLFAGQVVEIPSRKVLETYFRKAQLAESQPTQESTQDTLAGSPIEAAPIEAAPYKTARNEVAKKTHKIREGESLIDIARVRLGNANRWPEIYRLNRKLLGDTFDSLPAGHKLELPTDSIMTRRDNSELK